LKHKTEDYKNSAIKYYIKENKSLGEVCDIFSCKSKNKSLSGWVNKYKKINQLKDIVENLYLIK